MLTADNKLETLVLMARPSEPDWCPVELAGPNAPAPLLNFLNYLSPRVLPQLVAALRQHQGFGHNEEGYDYVPASNGPATVVVYDFVQRVEVTALSFQRLAARFLLTLIRVAEAQQDAVLQQPWWEDFVHDTQAFAEQVKPQPA